MYSKPYLLLLMTGSLLAISTLATATAQRTFVASSGNDAHACSLAQPCRSFAAAILKTNPGGEVIVLDSAGYGTVTITQAISIIASPGIYAGVSVFTGNGVTVNAPGATVVLRGLSINGQGGTYGISLQAAGRVRVESCVISEMASDGINYTAAGAEMIVLDTIVRDNGGTGIVVGANGGSINLDHVRSEHNTVDGFYIAPTQIFGFSVSATVTDSVFTQNGGNGIWGDTKAGATTTLLVEHSVLSNNGSDGFRMTAAASAVKGNVTLTRNAINSNGANGILIDTAAPALVTGAVSQNAMQGNGGDGIQVTGPGTTTSAQIILSANSSISNQSFDARCTSAHGLILSDHTTLLLTSSSVGCHGDIFGW